MAQSHREASRRLFEFAEQQQGFFTAKQARAAGFAENTHPDREPVILSGIAEDKSGTEARRPKTRACLKRGPA
jgi:hypothetical protein